MMAPCESPIGAVDWNLNEVVLGNSFEEVTGFALDTKACVEVACNSNYLTILISRLCFYEMVCYFHFIVTGIR